MHKPGEEKLMMVVLSEEEYAPWLEAPVQEARRMLNQYPGRTRGGTRSAAGQGLARR
ncbi:hypothetical protein OOT46_22950 [Aquabacterium sp. A7-Y]|uniref:hypothetical protein n=1 Tax=Aquabacterium sp. A7-Y TaxID=1349605 RepID=UPI00223D96E3|nr:hypothetical protein [Aquabacterium sp. A7-Y]MCW7540681.1 hypothetical protein [Aquabacterium sp. A7-Y]